MLNCLTILGQSRAIPAKSKAYLAGERLTYSLKFGGIQAGQAEIFLLQANYQNKPVYHAKVTAQTVGLAEKLYSVKDIFESYPQ